MIGAHPAIGRQRDRDTVRVGCGDERGEMAGPGRGRRHEEERQQDDRGPGRHAV